MKKLLLFVALIVALSLPSSSSAAKLFRVSAFNYSGSVSEETVTLKKISSGTLNMRKWTLQSSSGAKYSFPSFKLKKGESFTLQSGPGTQKLKGKRKLLFWNRTEKAWNAESGSFLIKNSKKKSVFTYSYSPPTAKSVFFIHHSTGQIYWNGGMKAALEEHGYSGKAPWWDGGTDPQDFPELFKSSDNWQTIGDAGIIIFKSCFPASNITSSEMLENYKSWYRELYAVYAAHPDRLFVPMSTPPLLKNNTSAAAATRALQFEDWLLHEYKNGYSGSNLAPFALHSLLSDSNGYLSSEFAGSDPSDDHPNSHSGEVVGEAIWKHLDNALK